MSNLEATIVVEFNGGDPDTDDYIFRPELDAISNEEKTTFLPEETPVFQVNMSNNVRVDAVVALEGSVKYIGEASRSETFDNVFTSRDAEDPTTYTLPVAPSSTSISYKGREGALTSVMAPAGMITYTGDILRTPFQAIVETGFPVSLYRLTPPDLELDIDETYEIIIVFYLTLV